jgi:hypothetical protein
LELHEVTSVGSTVTDVTNPSACLVTRKRRSPDPLRLSSALIEKS